MSSTTNDTTLYSYWRSSSSWRVRIALNFHNVSYNYNAVNLLENQQQQSDFVKEKNPSGAIPVLEIDGQVLTESLAIMEYLEETRGRKLLPESPADRAQVRKLALQIAAGIQPIQNLSVLKKVMADYGQDQKLPWGRHFIERGFKSLEQMLTKTSGKFSFGDSVTIADVCLVPQVYNANRFGVDMSQFPIIQRVHDECVKLEQFQNAEPSKMPDAPEGG